VTVLAHAEGWHGVEDVKFEVVTHAALAGANVAWSRNSVEFRLNV
jgi:hypothetical protein